MALSALYLAYRLLKFPGGGPIVIGPLTGYMLIVCFLCGVTVYQYRDQLPYTRAMLTAALEGQLDDVPMEPHPFFRTMVPKACPHVPPDFLDPRGMWGDKAAYDRAALDLSERFSKNFEKFANVSAEVLEGGPVVLARV